MKKHIYNSLLKRLPNVNFKSVACILLFMSSFICVKAQNGSYEKRGTKGAYSVISIQTVGNVVKAEIFAWWNSPNDQTGSYYGEGTLKNNTVVLHSDENEPGCKVTLSLVQGEIKAVFNNCSIDHLTPDFNGLHTKFTDGVAGDYMVTVPKAYFHKAADAGSKLKTYVLKGDKVVLDIDRIGASKQNWVFVYFTNKAGKETVGYMPLNELKRLN